MSKVLGKMDAFWIHQLHTQKMTTGEATTEGAKQRAQPPKEIYTEEDEQLLHKLSCRARTHPRHRAHQHTFHTAETYWTIVGTTSAHTLSLTS
jgi:hypothetical protein